MSPYHQESGIRRLNELLDKSDSLIDVPGPSVNAGIGVYT